MISGIHHVTAIASDPQRNLDFYTNVLGLRLVKLTVNFDDPGTYHFYFGDEAGRPGTILTFFLWPDARRGRHGNGQVGVTAFSIPVGSIGYWQERLIAHGVTASEPKTRFDDEVLSFVDPDGMRLELVAHLRGEAHSPWNAGSVSATHAIRGFHGAALWVREAEPTIELLVDAFGFKLVREAGERYRFKAESDQMGAFVDVVIQPNEPYGRMGAGAVHHVAWRIANDDEQLIWRQKLLTLGYNVTPVMDRQYFHSIYFREPGRALFEIATDPPGFTWDEPVEGLGSGLKLPPWLEPRRAEIERILPAIRLPVEASGD